MPRRRTALLVLAVTSLVAGCTVAVPGTAVTPGGISETPPSDAPSAVSEAPAPQAQVFDTYALEQGILKVLNNTYKMEAETVMCPPQEEDIVGNSFDCDVQAMVGRFESVVTITVTSTNGTFEVSEPRAPAGY